MSGNQQIGGFMHKFMKPLLFSLPILCATLTRCLSHKVGAALGEKAFEAVFETFSQPIFDLQYASNEFRVAKHRWPQDYDELSTFLKETDGTTYSSLQALGFHRIKFTETAESNLRIDADFTSNASGTLSGGGSYRVDNGKVSIDGMEVSPCDPHEMRLPRNSNQGA
jgi:hypothetical protein